MLQLLFVDPPHGRGKQIFHPYPHTTLPHISCIVTSLGILGKFRICGNPFVFQESDNATNLGVKCFEKREHFLKHLFGGDHLLKYSRVYFHLILQKATPRQNTGLWPSLVISFMARNPGFAKPRLLRLYAVCNLPDSCLR